MIYFAFCWAFAFGAHLRSSRLEWVLGTVTFFLTGLVGIHLLLFYLKLPFGFPERWATPYAADAKRFAYFVFAVGPREAFFKVLMVLIVLAVGRRLWGIKFGLKTALFCGALGGLGFAAWEQFDYVTRAMH